ncbi:hypothetical protein KXV85_005510 [Aspergillus fumigatus]|nr:hypothetical protein KXV85_005510 [Aspergillus fumigatus]
MATASNASDWASEHELDLNRDRMAGTHFEIRRCDYIRSVLPDPSPGEVPVSSSWDTAVVNFAGAKGFSIRMLPSTPCDFQSGALALVM